MLISNSVDLSETKNILIMSAILVSGIGGLVLKFGNVDSPFITITSIAVSMFLGILMNAILREKKEKTEHTL